MNVAALVHVIAINTRWRLSLESWSFSPAYGCQQTDAYEISPFITKYNRNQQFWNTLITMSEIPYYDLWNIKADIVILSFNNEWVLLVHRWQRQAAVEGSLWGDERAPDIPPCAQPSEAARHFEVELRQHWYGGSYKAKCFPWCLVGRNISSTYCWAYRFSKLSTRSILQSLETNHTLSPRDCHWYPSHYKRWHDMQPWLRRSPVN